MEDYRKIAIKLGQTLFSKAPETREDVERMLPELKESEDERIKKEMLTFFKGFYDNQMVKAVDVEPWIAWLEKQGEQKPVPDWMPKFLDELRSKKNYFDWDEHKDIEGRILAIIQWMNPNYFIGKDGEQKSDNRESSFLTAERAKEVLPFMRSGFENEYAAWSEEDEKEVAVLEAYICSKDWSERHIDRALGIVDELVNKVKFLRPQKQWKPSEKQIKVCKEVYADILSAKGFDLGTINSELNRLEEELKKLKG